MIDGDGKIHIFGGSHASPFEYWTSTNDYDPSSWTQQSDVGVKPTYPIQVQMLNGSILLFYREGGGADVDREIEYRTSWDTFSTAYDLVDFTSNNYMYPSDTNLSSDGSKIYFHHYF